MLLYSNHTQSHTNQLHCNISDYYYKISWKKKEKIQLFPDCRSCKSEEFATNQQTAPKLQ